MHPGICCPKVLALEFEQHFSVLHFFPLFCLFWRSVLAGYRAFPNDPPLAPAVLVHFKAILLRFSFRVFLHHHTVQHCRGFSFFFFLFFFFSLSKSGFGGTSWKAPRLNCCELFGGARGARCIQGLVLATKHKATASV